MNYYVYILRSKKDEKLYIGFTKDLQERIKRHNHGKVISTKYRIPFELIYHEKTFSLEEALTREKYLKGLKRERLKKLMANGGCSSVGKSI